MSSSRGPALLQIGQRIKKFVKEAPPLGPPPKPAAAQCANVTDWTDAPRAETPPGVGGSPARLTGCVPECGWGRTEADFRALAHGRRLPFSPDACARDRWWLARFPGCVRVKGRERSRTWKAPRPPAQRFKRKK